MLVEDDVNDAEIIRLDLRDAGFDPVSKVVLTAEAFGAALNESAGWDAIIADHYLPGFGALKALAMLAGTSASYACSGPLAQRCVGRPQYF